MTGTRSAPTTTRYSAGRLGLLLDEKGVKRAWLARKAGVSRGHMTHIINGKRTVNEETAGLIAEALGLPLFLLFEFSSGNETIPSEMVAVRSLGRNEGEAA